MDRPVADPLTLIRQRIDEVDETIHRALIERAAVIDELIRVKRTAAGAAFRPDREAAMMRRLVMRHEGHLPLPTVEHIWRELISTFTAMQAPYGIAAAPAEDRLAMRDLVRFYFGFHVPVREHASAAAAIAGVADGGRDLAVVPVATPGRWWRPLADPAAPKVFARLPFLETDGHPAALPAYVVGPPLAEPGEADLRLVAFAEADGAETLLDRFGARVVGRGEGELLAELPCAVAAADLQAAGAPLAGLVTLGGFAQPIRILSASATPNNDRTP